MKGKQNAYSLQQNKKFVLDKGYSLKDSILRHNKSFGGSLTDEETMKQAGISRKSFYKYKRELRSIS